MIIPLYDTTANKVADKLVSIRLEGGVIALSRVLTLVVPVGAASAEEAIAAANQASMEHPCRLIVLIEGDPTGKPALDAEIRVGGDAGASEVVVLRLRGSMNSQQASLVTPLLLPDVPVVTWWPDRMPESPAAEPLGALAGRRVTDSRQVPGSRDERLARLRDGYTPGDTDLSWTRLTWWRAHLASVLDQPSGEPVIGAVVTGPPDITSPVLLGTWLRWKLRCPVELVASESINSLTRVELRRASGAIVIDRPDSTDLATLTVPGSPTRRFYLVHQSLAECLSEELRRLDEDPVYGEVVKRGFDWLDENDRGAEAPAGGSKE